MEFPPRGVDGRDADGERGNRDGSAAIVQQKKPIKSCSIGGMLDFTEEIGVIGEGRKLENKVAVVSKIESAKVTKKDD